MDLMYSSTRDAGIKVTASRAILKGLAADGGLFVPDQIPPLDVSLKELADMSYQEVAYAVMKLYLTDFTETELKDCIQAAYDVKFDTGQIAPLVKADDAYFLELFHGPTIAFKDMALSILPHLMITSARKNNIKNEIVILTATSGDTGKAALAGFADVEGTRIIVYYPKNGVSPVQEKQMVTQKGENTHVTGIHGNFDQAQTGVKQMFADKELERLLDDNGFQFSSANSINIGRLVPQIVYYVYAYGQLLARNAIREGEEINFVVPTGNFGNILAACYAKNMGLPVHKLICASNENKVLYDFFQSGRYDKNREFKLTSSPSMDMREQLKDFYGNFTDERETAQVIRELYHKTGYVIDTHTAVAKGVYDKYTAETKDNTTTVIVSTASPFKFTRSVMNALNTSHDASEDFELIDELSRLAKVKVPAAIEEIRTASVRHHTECEAEQMPEDVKSFLGIRK